MLRTVQLLLLTVVLAGAASGQDSAAATGRKDNRHLQAALTGKPSDGGSMATSPSPVTNEELLQRIEALEQRIASVSSSESEQLTTTVAELKKSIDDNKTAQAATSKAVSSLQQFAQVGGQVFAYYSYTTTGMEGKDYNRFDLDRIYLNAKAQVFDQAKVNLTTDIYRNSATGSYYAGLAIRLKFAYLDYSPVGSLSLKFGMIPTVWPGFIDTYWKYRGVVTNVTDKNSYFSTADLGFSAAYTLPGKIGEVTGFMLNGSGYTSPETNRFKDYALRVNVAPFTDDPIVKSLTVAGYVYKGSNMSKVSTALQRDRFGGMVYYSYDVASIGVDVDVRKDAATSPDTVVTGNAVSWFGEIKSPFADFANKFSVLWRYDIVDPNTDKGMDMQRFYVLGLVFKPHERLSFVLDKEWTKAESSTLVRNDGTKTDYDNRWFLHTIVNF